MPSMLNVGMLSFFLAMLVFTVHANARNVITIKKLGSGHSFDGLPPEFICKSCLEASREQEKFLADPKMVEQAHMLSNEVCHIMPSDYQVKCIETVEMYIDVVISFLQQNFCEEKLCNSTGLCPQASKTGSAPKFFVKEPISGFQGADKMVSIVQQMFSLAKERLHAETIPQEVHVQTFTDKVSDNKSCSVCRRTLDQILNDLDNLATKCKKLAFEYTLILANIKKFLTNNDLCSILKLCGSDTAEVAAV